MMSRLHDDEKSRNPVRGAIVTGLAIAVLFLSCGKKGVPSPPQIGPPPSVTDLALELTDDFLVLSWTVPKGKKKLVSSFAGFFVYRSKQSVSAEECKGCPILFSRVADVPIEGEKPGEDLITYSETIEKGFRYIYKVKLYTQTGAIGGDSKLVKIAY